jgi:hypothetical protein
VTTPHTVTISASLNGTSISKSIVVRPGRLAAVSPSSSGVSAGEPLLLTLTFDAAVTSAPVTFASSDTAVTGFTTTASGTTAQKSLATTKSLRDQTTATITVTSGGGTKNIAVQVNPIKILTFGVSPASGIGGTSLAATVKLTHTALQPQLLELFSSDTTVATIPSPATIFNIGEDVKVVTVRLRGPQSATRTATITAKVHVSTNNASTSVINERTATVTATP